MFKGLSFFVRFYLVWLVFFALDRFVFMFIFHKKLREIPLSEKIAAFYHGLRLDFSMTAYLIVIPFFYFLFFYFSKKETLPTKFIRIYNQILIVLFSLFNIINFNIYREWGTKINVLAIKYAIDTPNEALASSASSPLLLSFFVFIIYIMIGFYSNFIAFKTPIELKKANYAVKTAIAVLLLFVNFLFIRGGLGTSPNSQSNAYFSKYNILNIASLNTEWNLISSILAADNVNHNPYQYLSLEEANAQVKQLFSVEKDSTIHILKTNRPNVVLFILESFTADLTKTLGNEDGITPSFDSLINRGVFFNNIYAAGDRTDKGVFATLASQPTLGTGILHKWVEKMQKLPAISQKLTDIGYNSSFFYGGESEFQNYKAFMLSHGYQTVIDKKYFDQKDLNSKWGAFDGAVFTKQQNFLAKTKQPFFSTILSLTNHEPFELPGAYKFGKKDNIERFKSTAHYTDSCINAYLNNAKKEPWYKNTLFIFVADHGHLYPKNKYEIFMPQRFHIPLLFYGDVIKDEFKGKTFSQTGSQQDISSTLLHQMDIPANDFIWSKNLLNPYTKHFAFYTWDNGFGFITDSSKVTFDNVGKMPLYIDKKNTPDKTKEDIKFGKAYLQAAYHQFIKL